MSYVMLFYRSCVTFLEQNLCGTTDHHNISHLNACRHFLGPLNRRISASQECQTCCASPAYILFWKK